MSGLHWIVALLATLIVILFFTFTMPKIQEEIAQQQQLRIKHEGWGCVSCSMKRQPK